jgi:hypothetical protein
MAHMINELRERLLAQDFLYTDPSAYRAGVERTLSEVRAALGPADPAEAAGAE